MQVGIRAVEGSHMAIIRAEPGKGTGLHNHKTVEVFMPLTGKWSVIWGDEGESELQIGQYDTISIPPGVLRGFRNDSDHEALLLALVGGALGLAAASAMQAVDISTTNFQTFSEIAFQFRLTPEIALRTLGFALAMGLAGGFIPAWRAARMRIVDCLREA